MLERNDLGLTITSPLLTVDEVCDILHVRRNTLRRWADQGLIRVYRIGPRRDRRFRAEDLADLIVEAQEPSKRRALSQTKRAKRRKNAS